MKLRYDFLLFAFLLCPFWLASQVVDDFSDGNFTANPAWLGSQNKFIVNTSFQLQLNDSQEGIAYLATANGICNEAEWHFWVKLSFSPSSNNFARIYLVSDKEDITQPLNGYFLQLGEAGSDDAIELFKQTGTSLQSVCRGTAGLLATSFTVSIKVTRKAMGEWVVYADPSGGDQYQLEAEGIDNTYTQTNFIGFYCQYTVSNANKFYFDNVYAGQVIVDGTPPVLLSVSPVSDSSLLLNFDETIDKQSAEKIDNYMLDNGFGNPDLAAIVSGKPSEAMLYFGNKFVNGTNYLLSVSGVNDLAGNEMIPQEFPFSYYKPQTYDVVFNEIMADPNPVVGLPDWEYLELFNRTGQNISLKDWVLTIGTSEKIFSDVIIPPNGYLILGNEEAASELGVYGLFYGFSSFTLTNSGQSLILMDNEGNLISSVTYSIDWLDDPAKEDGGWSLEQINPENICSGSANWEASINGQGGTPGAINSVNNAIVLLPALERLEMAASNILQLYFNQAMDPASLSDLAAYSVSQSVGNPAIVYTFDEQPYLAELYFENEFTGGIVYQLTISESLSNCLGISLPADTLVLFGIGETPSENDVVINEILFNPWTDGVDYVEIYNRSGKVIDLSKMKIGKVTLSPPNPPDTAYYTISTEQLLVVPATYMLLSSSPSTVQSQYYTSNPNGFLRVAPFPSYNNDEGTCLLANISGEIVDAFNYNEKMQYPLLNYVDGVALERTNFDSPTNDASNWHSAAESVGFGTPAYLNSQFVPEVSSTDEITIQPEIFSPDNDGYNDIISVQYNFDQPGYMLTVNIFNSKGQLIKQLVNNEYVGTAGSFNWDGLANNNTLAPVGIYVFFIEIYDLNGNVRKFKKTGVLATKL
jgi:hypothetical protein